MRQENITPPSITCADCDQFWRAYEAAVFEDVRLHNRLKVAEASGDSDAAGDLARETAEAGTRRNAARARLLEHEGTAEHRSVSTR